MPWEITIVKSPADESLPLGERQAVIDAVEAALPGMRLANPPTPPAAFLDSLPPAAQAAFTRKVLEGCYEEESFTIQFQAADAPEIRNLLAEIRGDGNPLPALHKLCRPNGWSVIDADGEQVDLSATTSPQWEAFREFRDRAFGEGG